MSFKTLLCIDSLQDYDLIDHELLFSLGIHTQFLIKDLSKASIYSNTVFTKSFSFEDLFIICNSVRPDYIVCFSEEMFVDIAKVRDDLQIPGMHLEKAMLLSRKDLMYQKLQGLFPYPKATEVGSSDFESIINQLNTHNIFIKPVNSSGSYETYHINTEEEFKKFIASRKESEITYIAQPFVNSDLFHSEIAVYNGTILFAEARKYTSPNHLMVSRGLPIFSLNILDPQTKQLIIDATIIIKNLLDFNNGVLHTEFFMGEKGEIQFLETNARPPGIGLNKLYKKKYSISLETILCCIVCEVQPPKLMESENHFICGYFPRKEGLVKQIIKPNVGNQNEWTIFIKPGDRIETAKHMSKAAMVICWDNSLEKVNEIGEFLSEQQIVEIEQ